MTHLDTLCGFLSQTAPLKLAESWDNVGLLIGDRTQGIQRVMTCLTITPNVVTEAIDKKANLIVTHHPLPFQPLKRLTSDTTTGKMLLDLISNGIAIYSAHTAYDSAENGINQQWCDLLGVQKVKPLIEFHSESETNTAITTESHSSNSNTCVGSGRYGRLPVEETLEELSKRAAEAVTATSHRIVGDPQQVVKKVAFACGSGGSFLSQAVRFGCDAMITGEATFHICLEAEARGIGLILLGHYHSERFAMESLAKMLSEEFPDIRIWPSNYDQDPLSDGGIKAGNIDP